MMSYTDVLESFNLVQLYIQAMRKFGDAKICLEFVHLAIFYTKLVMS